jgi:hypothetical protein
MCGLFTRRLGWRLSWRGWLAVLTLGLVGGGTLLCGVQPFLAVSKPVPSETLVIEGWITDHAFVGVLSEIKKGVYKRIYTTGGLADWDGASAYGGTFAGYCAMRLRSSGIDEKMVIAIPSSDRGNNRTFRSAVAVARFLDENESPKSINVLTMGPHARRTRLTYEKAIGPATKIGIISLKTSNYDQKHWWRTSLGVREVIGEGVGYLYCRLVPGRYIED